MTFLCLRVLARRKRKKESERRKERERETLSIDDLLSKRYDRRYSLERREKVQLPVEWCVPRKEIAI